MTNQEIYELVHSYPCESKYGFNSSEIKDILSKFPDINLGQYFDAMMGNTGIVDGGLLITYHCDLILGLTCGIENRIPKIYEFD
jgi:hypothetical protein